MENVEFNEEPSNSNSKRLLYGKFQMSSIRPGLVNLLIKNNVVKTEKQANVVLLIVVIICVIASYIFFKSAFETKTFTEEEIQQAAHVI